MSPEDKAAYERETIAILMKEKSLYEPPKNDERPPKSYTSEEIRKRIEDLIETERQSQAYWC